MVHFECNVFHGLTKNKMFIGIWLVCVCVQVVAVQVPGFNRCFSATALDLKLWLFCIGAGVLTLLWGIILSSIGSLLKPFVVRKCDWRQIPAQDDDDDARFCFKREEDRQANTSLAQETKCSLPQASSVGRNALRTIRCES
eukprot:TRINITY_DN11121_c0_g1_i1.p1 TRINITY_DN11121_c0_g1~~TRINITY_DN11121_c0_g1_i1.p1  ORF type:complete len:141 (-),score=7.15 TRINITY_DN11121_c0_g1_i1:725-1147(-)